MIWDAFVDGARAVSWVAYVGTADGSGVPHVAAVAPGFTEGTIWFATRIASHKYQNLLQNTQVAFHWPVAAGSGPGELFARGHTQLHSDEISRRRLWTEANLPFDPAQFFGSPDNPDFGFVETTVTSASILGPDFNRSTYRP